MKTEIVPIDEPTPDPANARKHGERNLQAIIDSLRAFGQQKPIVLDRRGVVVAGNGTLEAARRIGWTEIAVVRSDLDPTQATAFGIADNRTAELAEWDADVLRSLVDSLDDDLRDVVAFADDELDALLDKTVGAGEASGVGSEPPRPSLHDRFGVPPFSILDQRQGYWQARRRRWLDLGIASEIGREGDLLGEGMGRNDPAFYLKKKEVEDRLGRSLSYREYLDDYYDRPETACTSGTSVFDPVLAEILVRWFSPPGGTVLDPFAGGSVRGIVSAALGRDYVGVDLRADQVAENRQQWDAAASRILTPATRSRPEDFTPAITPIERRGGILFKREDLWTRGGARGAKSRTMFRVCEDRQAEGLISAGARISPQIERAAMVAEALGIPCRVHTGIGPETDETRTVELAGGEIVRTGTRLAIYLAAARKDAEARPTWATFPFGMGIDEYAEDVAEQVEALPFGDFDRLVCPCGSGMTLAGILRGLDRAGRLGDFPIVAVRLGHDPAEYLDRFAPATWRDVVTFEDGGAFEDRAEVVEVEGILLDPMYEAKAIPFLRPGDLFWVVGLRESCYQEPRPDPTAIPIWVEGDSREIKDLVRADLEYDFVLSCPPYADLERYSDDPADLSTLDYDQFLEAYAEIIGATVDLLAEDSFVGWVVGEIRGPDGFYRGFVRDTIEAFEEAGATLYNEAVLVSSPASAPIRAARYLETSRKLVKTHQTVLVFVKGDPKRATERCGDLAWDESVLEGLDDGAA